MKSIRRDKIILHKEILNMQQLLIITSQQFFEKGRI